MIKSGDAAKVRVVPTLLLSSLGLAFATFFLCVYITTKHAHTGECAYASFMNETGRG